MTPKAKRLMDGECVVRRGPKWQLPLESVHALNGELLLGETRYSPGDLCWMSACMVLCVRLDKVGFRKGETVLVVLRLAVSEMQA